MLLIEWNIKMGAKAARTSTSGSEKIPEKIRGSDPDSEMDLFRNKTQMYEAPRYMHNIV